MNDERFLSDWLKDEAPDDADPRASADRIMARVPDTPQRRRWWPFGRRRRAARSPADDGPATTTGRSDPVFDAMKIVAAAVIVAAFGGALLVAQPFDRQGAAPPGAEVDAEPIPPVPVTARYRITESQLRPQQSLGLNASGGARSVDGAWRWSVVEPASDGRLRGNVAVIRNVDWYPTYPGIDGQMTISHYSLEIENADGAWRSWPIHGVVIGSEPMDDTIVLIGERAFEGFYVVGRLTKPMVDAWDLSGVIFAGDPPPPPRSLDAE